jgi:CHAD domain-containing protein
VGEREVGLGSTVIDPSLSVGDVAFAVLRMQFEAFVAKEAGSRRGEDPEDVHDMRVASRRLRAAIAMFRDVLPARIVRLREELGWVARALGAVRDLDVQLGQLETWVDGDLTDDADALGALRDLLERERAGARVELTNVLDSPRYARLLADFTKLLRVGPMRSHASREAILMTGAPLIRRRHRDFRKAGDQIGEGATGADYHRLRIRAKRLRYALEFLADVYPGAAVPLIRRLVALQDLLGARQDADVAVQRLHALAMREGDDLPPRTAFAMGMVAERYRREGADLQGLFPKIYRRVGGKPWRELRQFIKEPLEGSGA